MASEREERLKIDLGDGKDELNLAEFPLSLISRQASDSAKVLVFEDTVYDSETRTLVPRKVTISGSADCGLPSAADEEVLLALIQITKQQGFRSERVVFSRYHLLQILGWEDTGYYYNRVLNALNVWLGVNVKWHNAWRDYTKGTSWGNKGIVLIQDFELKRRDQKDSSSHITWARQLFESFQAGNLKGLDFGLYRALRNSIAKRMFRFLDKRFYNRETLTFDLATFAYEKIGMKRSYQLPNVKQQFRPAIEELEKIGFLKPMEEAQRYRKRRAGEWDVTFSRAEEENGQRPLPMEIDALPDVENELVKRGVSRTRAKSLAARFPEAHIRSKLEEFDFRLSRGEGDPLRPKNPGGYLAQAISEDYATPKGFKSKADQEQERREKEAQSAARKNQRAAKAKAEEDKMEAVRKAYLAKAQRAENYLASLLPEVREQVIADALASNLFGAKAAGLVREAIIHEHVWSLLPEGKEN